MNPSLMQLISFLAQLRPACCVVFTVISSNMKFHLPFVFLPIKYKIHFGFAELSSKLSRVINYGFSEIFSLACGKNTLIWFNSR